MEAAALREGRGIRHHAFDRAQARLLQVSSLQQGFRTISCRQVSRSEHGVTRIGPAQVGATQIGPTEIGTPKLTAS